MMATYGNGGNNDIRSDGDDGVNGCLFSLVENIPGCLCNIGVASYTIVRGMGGMLVACPVALLATLLRFFPALIVSAKRYMYVSIYIYIHIYIYTYIYIYTLRVLHGRCSTVAFFPTSCPAKQPGQETNATSVEYVMRMTGSTRYMHVPLAHICLPCMHAYMHILIHKPTQANLLSSL